MKIPTPFGDVLLDVDTRTHHAPGRGPESYPIRELVGFEVVEYPEGVAYIHPVALREAVEHRLRGWGWVEIPESACEVDGDTALSRLASRDVIKTPVDAGRDAGWWLTEEAFRTLTAGRPVHAEPEAGGWRLSCDVGCDTVTCLVEGAAVGVRGAA